MKPDMTIKMGPPCFAGIKDLEQNVEIDEQQILEVCSYIDARYDCADFRMICILRTLYSYTHLLSSVTLDAMKDSVLNFKYWMDEPGEDNMCVWSENHQMIFSVIEYLAGQLYPNEIFTNNNMSGAERMQKAEKRILDWLYYRFTYGFTEWHSNVYYEEDVAPLSLLIDFCENETIVTKAKMIMDILLLDMAMFSWKGLFGATSGRCYTAMKKHPLEQPTLQINEKLFEFGNIEKYDYSKMSADFLLNRKYDIPHIIREIGKDDSTVIIKDSMGLDLSEIKKEFSDLDDIHTTGMFLWSMESFTNPESIDMALKIFNKWKLHNNSFLKDLKMVNYKLLIKLKLLPLLVRILNPITQGIAIQRANSYIYKTQNYSLSTAQNHHPKQFADQQHIWQATLSDEITVFTTHPGRAAFSDIDRNFSPDYWVGSGILPHSVQHKNIHMSIYDLRKRKGFMEKKRLMFTHAYFPQKLFEEVVHDGRYLMGKYRDSYIALIGRYPLVFNPTDNTDCIQNGKLTYWICVLGSKQEDSSFDLFVQKIKRLNIEFDKKTLIVKAEDVLQLKYKGNFSVNNNVIQTEHARLESPYGDIERKPKQIRLSFKNSYIHLDFDKLIREHGIINEEQK